MNQTMTIVFAIAIALFIMQSVGGYFQVKNYQQTLKKLHKMGNVGIGQKKGGLLSGHIVMIVCSNTGTILATEVLDGISFNAKFKPKTSLLGEEYENKSIYSFLEKYRNLDTKKQKAHQGYIRALEALEMRLKKETQ